MARLLLFFLICSSAHSFGQSPKQALVTTDIAHFWRAYDCIQTATDSAAKMHCLQTEYLAKASPGLHSLLRVRNYTAAQYLQAIQDYPLFWASIRRSTQNLNDLTPQIQQNIARLRRLYPGLRPAPIYFAMGAFRTPGTIDSGRVLVGSEMALVDTTVISQELPARLQAYYRDYKPRSTAAFLCTHEYVHTQQKPMVNNLLSMCLYEGIAEFAATLATGKPPTSPNIVFGQQNEARIFTQFAADLFLMSNDGNWLWAENRNALKVRDLGYYVGYAIAESHYRRAKNKRLALKQLIELNYEDEALVEQMVDATQLLPKPLKQLYAAYESSRPVVVSTSPFAHGSSNVPAGVQKISFHFSRPLNGHHTGIDFGPLGANACPPISRERVWSNEGKTYTIEADLKPGKRYQLLITSNFRTAEGIRLKPFLLEFTTAE